MTTDDIINDILRREGGYVHHAADKGGPTHRGVTQAVLSEWLGRPASIDDVKNLTEHETREIYTEIFVMRPGFLSIKNDAVRTLAVDCAVNHGAKQAVKLLQRSARVFPDGILGPITRDAANRMAPGELYRRLCASRVRLYGEIISRDHSQAVFAAGWLRRAAEFIEVSP